MRLDLLPGELAIVRLGASVAVPQWLGISASAEPVESTAFLSITRTREELSIVCESSRVPAGIAAERGWRCLKVDGPLDFSLVGVLASLSEPLARAGIPIFVVSTFDTDYILVRNAQVEPAISALASAGHQVAGCRTES